MNKSALVFRLAIVVIFAASAVGFLSTLIFYRITYLNELALSKTKLTQLHSTISPTASIATYLEEQEMVTEVVNGLLTNDIVKGVDLVSPSLKITSPLYEKTKDTLEFKIFSPFEPDRVVGTLSITPNLVEITKRANKISFDNVFIIGIQTAIVTLIIIIVAYVVVTRPIIQIADRLHHITPGTKKRVRIPVNHKHSELGSLVVDINLLLDKTAEQIKQERNLRDEVERLSRHFRTLFEQSTSPIILTEPKGNILLYNEAFLHLLKKLDIPFKRSYGPYLRELFIDQALVDDCVEMAFANDEIASGEFQLINNNQEIIWVQCIITASITDAYNEHHQITLHDISKRKQQLEQLDKTANTDKLTQLLNRRGGEQKINALIQSKTPFALLLLDLNKFKPINDIHGHETGDAILIHVASQLTKGMRRRDILSRWGGDEFIIVLPNIPATELKDIADKIIALIEAPLFIPQLDSSLSVTASIGATLFPDDQTSLKALLECADQAMYWSKEKQRTNPQKCFSLYHDWLAMRREQS
ncbi:sensor domain-containing diguanylate cyclase [Thalassotalea sp. G2M2-11]|uniref:sensor domain-containing diguanylate cyclase n=1 Tax=Thalassotalea sp. G2M2-11 TaxID=2787627 RepID=UPI0019CF514F|nr:sensor domain-containing diguanylate cyclase [Thalassotalea sp. G2M2-11]